MEPIPDYTRSVSEELKSLTVSGTLQADAAQMAVAARLDKVWRNCAKRVLPRRPGLGWLFARKERKDAGSVQGLYVYGSVDGARPCSWTCSSPRRRAPRSVAATFMNLWPMCMDASMHIGRS